MHSRSATFDQTLSVMFVGKKAFKKREDVEGTAALVPTAD